MHVLRNLYQTKQQKGTQELRVCILLKIIYTSKSSKAVCLQKSSYTQVCKSSEEKNMDTESNN